MYRTMAGTTGFLRGVVSVADPFTLINVSVWANGREMLQWSGNPDHLWAVRWTYGRSQEVWSGIARLSEIRPNAQIWGGAFSKLGE